jgi:hypothetical protein
MYIEDTRPNSGTNELWLDELMRDYYDRSDPVGFEEDDEGRRVARVRAEVGNPLIDRYDHIEELSDESPSIQPASTPDDDNVDAIGDSDSDSDLGTESTLDTDADADSSSDSDGEAESSEADGDSESSDEPEGSKSADSSGSAGVLDDDVSVSVEESSSVSVESCVEEVDRSDSGTQCESGSESADPDDMVTRDVFDDGSWNDA